MLNLTLRQLMQKAKLVAVLILQIMGGIAFFWFAAGIGSVGPIA